MTLRQLTGIFPCNQHESVPDMFILHSSTATNPIPIILMRQISQHLNSSLHPLHLSKHA